jgi:predicted Ser/Thr protein kinase
MSARARRTSLIKDNLDHISCLTKWKIGKVLGEGTVGSVFYACERKDKCAAVKIQVIRTEEEAKSYHDELMTQKAFANAGIGPKVYTDCFVQLDDNVALAAIVMETLDMMLDDFLSKRRTSDELKAAAEGLTRVWEALTRHRFTHGDLALFNIARTTSGRWTLLDFDRSSANSRLYSPRVDWLRLKSESYVSTRAMHTKRLTKQGNDWLKKMVGEWKTLFQNQDQAQNAGEWDDLWVEEYERYCRAVGVKCLE